MQVGDHPQSLRAAPAAVCIGVAALGCSNEEGRLGARAALCANMVEPFRGTNGTSGATPLGSFRFRY